jgi:hypothetical protein
MQLTLQPNIRPLSDPLKYTDKVLLIGSCFTEHMSGRLEQHKFKTLQNPHGILFNSGSVAQSLRQYIEGTPVEAQELFLLNETWNSWDYHSRFSGTDKEEVLAGMNRELSAAHDFIRQADWLFITLGSSYQYVLRDNNRLVTNNHRAPAQWFDRRLAGIDEMVADLKDALAQLHAINPTARVMFTVSPVRHIRDGVVENNRSKGRLIDTVHTLCELLPYCYYFPAYELVIDILRDYRFYDIDFVHPNYLATTYVWDQFTKACIDPGVLPVMEQVKDIMTARAHRARFEDTDSHRKFLKSYTAKVQQLMEAHPYLDLREELDYFNRTT